MQGQQHINSHANNNRESIWFKTKLASQFLSLSFLLTQPFYLPYLHAAPIGGNVVGGSGSIRHSDLTTTINQSTQNLAINWQSFNVKQNERVQFIQPNSSSIALNRIIGNNGSVIQGRIDANGQVFLVNPYGILFTPSARVNVGGLVASSLDISPADFMNGNYIFNEVIGTDGAVINSGVINAATGGKRTGGNVALIGKQVKNDGLITARLGSTALAAGKKIILRFDNLGLIGVRVKKEILQKEIGLDEAVINSGKIKAAGGRVLLTASVSRDVFSQAVNTRALKQATSAVVHEDGSFTLGRGADVLNTGSIDVSSASNLNNARVVMLGENITSSGVIKADVQNGTAGNIELHATHKTLLTENSLTSAQAFTTGQGGLIKILGDKVGLFDTAQVNASGVNGGGDVLIGGDRQGLNALVRNADFIYLGEKITVKADATDNGNGGKIITFAKDTARIKGNLLARGGLNYGNGGFIETSGLIGFEISNTPDVTALNGNAGTWLIDPNNIRIINNTIATDPLQTKNVSTTSPFQTKDDGAILEVGLIETALTGGGTVLIETTSSKTNAEAGNISFEANLDIDSIGDGNSATLKLKADNNITFTNASSISDSALATVSQLGLDLNAGGNVSLNTNATGINLYGGNFVVSNAKAVTFDGAVIKTAGGSVDIKNSTAVAFNGGAITTGGNDFILSTTGNVTSANSTTNTINLTGGNFIVNDAVDFDSSNVSINVGKGSINLDGGGNGVIGKVVLGELTASDINSSDLTITKATSIRQAAGSTIFIAQNTDLDVTTGTGSHSITLEESTNNFKTIKLQGANVSIVDKNRIDILGGTNVTNTLKIKAAGNIRDLGNIVVSNINKDAIAIFDTTKTATTFGKITLDNNNNFNNVKILNANNVELKDTKGSIAIEANNGVNSGGIRGLLTVTTTDNKTTADGNITGMGGVLIPGGGGTKYTGEINVGGAATFNVATGRSILLGNTQNTFDGTVNFGVYNHNSPKIKDITLADSTALNLPTISITGDLNVTAERIQFEHTNVQGDLTATTTGVPTATNTKAGEIVQVGEHIFMGSPTGLATFDASGDITLTTSANDFKDVKILNGRNVSIRDTDAMTLLSSNTSGNLKIQTGNVLTLMGNISTNSRMNAATGYVWFTGADTVLGANVIIDTQHVNGTGNTTDYADGYVKFDNKVDSQSGGTLYDLSILSDTGKVTFVKELGSTNALNKLSITSSTATTSPGVISLQNVTTSGGGIKLTGKVLLSNNITLDTTAGTSDGAVKIVGAVKGAQSLTIKSGSNDVDLQQAIVGATTALSSLVVTGDTVSLGNVTTTGAIDVTGNTNGAINLSGILKTTSGNIDLKKANVILNGNATLQVAATSTNTITIEGTVNADLDTRNRNLTIKAGSGLVDLKGDVGTGANGALQSLTVTSTGTTHLQKVTTGAGGVSVTTATLNALDNITTADGNVTFTASNSINTGANVFTMDTGLGDIKVNRTLNAANGFNVASSGYTTLNGVTVSNAGAMLDVTTSNGLKLTGAYSTDDTAMNFNADSDGDGTGALALSNNASFRFSNIDNLISFTGASYSAGTGVIIDAGTNRVQFNATADLTLGRAAAFSLTNAQLANITAGTLEFNAANDINFSNISHYTGPAYILNAGGNISNTGGVSEFNTLTANATNSFNLDANITTNKNLSLTGSNIDITKNILLRSNNGDVILNGVIQGASGQLNMTATNGTAQIVQGSSVNGLGSLTVNANAIDLGLNNKVTTYNNISLTSATTYNQKANLSSSLGNIAITSTNGAIGLASNTTKNGSITISAKNRIFDNNGATTNITSSGVVNLTASGGIGTISDPLELAMNGPNAWLSATNSGSGDIAFINMGDFRLENISNTASGGAFSLKNTGGNVTINSLKIDKGSDLAIATFDVTGGNVLGVQGGSAPHVTANTALFNMNNSGSVGVLGEPLITDVPNKIEVLSATGTFIAYFGRVPPKDFIGDNDYRNRALQSIESLSGQQLIEVELLAEIDPAIFTDVRNYTHTDIALLMPSDQRYAADDEEDDESAKQKRNEFIHSTP